MAREVGAEGGVDLAGDVTLQTADDLALGLAFAGAALGVDASALAVAQANDRNQVQGSVGVAVAARVEAVARGLARGGGDGAGATQRGEGGFAGEALDVFAGGREKLAGVSSGDAEQPDGARCGALAELLELAVERGDLVVEGFDSLRD